MRAITLKSGGLSLCFSGAGHALSSLSPGGHIAPGKELLRLWLRPPDGAPVMIPGSAFASKKFDGAAFVFERHPRFPGLAARVEVRTSDGFFYFRPSVSGLPESWWLELLEAVNPVTPANGKALVPFSEGMLCDSPAEHDLSPDPAPGHLTNYYRYPGLAQMQFLAFIAGDGGGLYFGAHDPEHSPKRVLFHGRDRWEFILGVYCAAQGSYESPFEYAIGVFGGGWMGAAEIYRGWVHDENKLRRNDPPWAADSPVVVTYAVCGEGPLSGKTNEFIPYINALPHLTRIAEETGSKIMALPLRGDQHGPWLPPYLWPPRGGEASLAELRDGLHAGGHLLGLYGSGISFTVKSLTTDYHADPAPFENDLARFADGSPMLSNEAGIRDSILFCPQCKPGRDIAMEQTRLLAGFGVDFFQLFDQNLGGGYIYGCRAKNHGHPPVPGRHETAAWGSLFRELNSMLKSMRSPMIIGTECAAAHPHINELPFNDLRPQMAWGFGGAGRPVPLYQFVFHEYINNFSGNQCMADKCDHERSPDNLLWRTAYGFNSGDMLTVPMRGGGEVDWGAASDWKLPPPNRKHILTLVRNMNSARKKCPEFLRHGKMLRPLLSLSGGEYELHMKDRTVMFDSFFQSSWEAPDGSRAQIITNFLPGPQTVSFQSPAGSVFQLDGKTLPAAGELELSPLSAVCLTEK
jgi:hypothetical protein